MKTLYVNRPLLNGEEVVKWAKSVGFETTLLPSDMHVTIAFSKKEVDWDLVSPDNKELFIPFQPNRKIEKFGELKNVAVMTFDSDKLSNRWQDFINIGASWDFPNYSSHITISYESVNVNPIYVYEGPLYFGGEVFKEVVLNWDKKIKES